MFGMILSIQIATAESKPVSRTVGAFWNESAVESSMGFQRYHHGVGGWWQQCQSSPDSKWTVHQPMQTCWHHTVRAGLNAQTIPSTESGWLDTHMLTSAVTLDTLRGVTLGSRTTQVGFFAGAGLDLFVGGTESIVATVRPSIVAEIQLQIPLQEHVLWFSGGQRIWVHRANPMFGIGWGTEW